MTEREPLERSTQQLIEDGRARQEALAGIDTVLQGVHGTAYDNHASIRVTVDGRGKLVELWLREDAVRWGADQLGRLIVMVAEAAMAQATQAGYNKLGPLLGDNLTQAVELISGRAAPARRDTGPGITAEEFQRRRDERVRAAEGGSERAGSGQGDHHGSAPGGGQSGDRLRGNENQPGEQLKPAMGSGQRGPGGTAGRRPGAPVDDDGFDPDDPLSFDLSSLRSDR
ncbi:YbaB/EbfC family nucleoid-associated protein [Actinokineospora sp. NBRC 105648]|uniref:YbaB/EbfC family nucleoid-associated protein n=1 Tax=Actinokineospora sp. NBRC 105648 TaxID=3032206 RepID=UPI00249FCF76|nr:YbaB/EbfC family nucleoid-associated protein [Actinokineospora sp. NBRC 105648]GLZ39256.1 hypothetical protein Acsp05_28800 [Actinokineospora sp. NBRC 105648]